MNVIYKGKDITDSVEVSYCIHDQYAEDHADTLTIQFQDRDKLWDQWSPKIDDTIQVREGNADTGKLYVRQVSPLPGFYEIRASSMPLPMKNVMTRSWEEITKLQLLDTIASDAGISVKTYGVKDSKWKYLKQERESDVNLLMRLSDLEGDSFLFYDNTLVYYNIRYMESLSTDKTIDVPADGNYKYFVEPAYCSLTLTNGASRATATDDGAIKFERQLKLNILSPALEKSYAKNYLKKLNRKINHGSFYTQPVTDGYAAGSVAKIRTDGASSFNEKIFITHVRNDFLNQKTKIFFRKV